jgi:hypothetical protein
MILTQQKKCVLQAWLLLEESKAPQLYGRCLKHTRPDNTVNVKQVEKKLFYENYDSYTLDWELRTEGKTNLRFRIHYDASIWTRTTYCFSSDTYVVSVVPL